MPNHGLVYPRGYATCAYDDGDTDHYLTWLGSYFGSTGLDCGLVDRNTGVGGTPTSVCEEQDSRVLSSEHNVDITQSSWNYF